MRKRISITRTTVSHYDIEVPDDLGTLADDEIPGSQFIQDQFVNSYVETVSSPSATELVDENVFFDRYEPADGDLPELPIESQIRILRRLTCRLESAGVGEDIAELLQETGFIAGDPTNLPVYMLDLDMTDKQRSDLCRKYAVRLAELDATTADHEGVPLTEELLSWDFIPQVTDDKGSYEAHSIPGAVVCHRVEGVEPREYPSESQYLQRFFHTPPHRDAYVIQRGE